MLFSILVPVYNSESYLAECVESVLRQSEQDFELVLVDDGSTDGGGQLCEQYHAQYPEKIRVIHQTNQGLILARRAGIAAAKGEYCMFLDADDAYEPECLSTVRETIERTGADIVIFNNYSYFEDDQSREMNTPVFPDNTLFCGADKRRIYEELIVSWRLNNIWAKAIRTPLLQADDTPYERYAANPHTEDLLQTLYPATHANAIAYRTKALYLYRRHSRSMTRKIDIAKIGRLYNAPVLNQLRLYMGKWGMDTPQYVAMFQKRKLNALLVLFWQHYRAATSAEQKRAVLSYDWAALLDEESRRFLRGKQVSFLRRLQLNAVFKRQKALLELFAAVGNLKMRASHGA